MNNDNERSMQDLPELHQRGDRLLVLAGEILANVQYSEDDHLGFMSLCFLSKQIGHMQSILTLSPSRDTILIARSMIEGLCQLLWAADEPDKRPMQWRAFAWVHDLRVMEVKEAQGETVSFEQHNAIENALCEIGKQFLKKKKRDLKQMGSISSESYHDNWRCGEKIWKICESVGGADLYKKLYEPFSDWHHWGIAGLSSAIERQGERVVYLPLSTIDSATAIACGFQCLLQTAELTDKRLCTGLESKIHEIRNGYVNK